MSFDIENDRTDHNRFAEQFAARLREQMEASAPVVTSPPPGEVSQAEPAPKKARKPRVAVPEPPIVIEVTAPEIVVPATPRVLPAIEVITCEQNNREWHLARMGIPTASSFDAILTPGKTKAEQKTRHTYMLKLAAEVLTGEPTMMVTTRDMERGHLLEPEARDLYALQTGTTPERVGFIRRGRVAGCSPDSLIGDDGGLEIKTKLPHLVLDLILKDEFPEEHKAQVQGALWLTGREWWDLYVAAAIEIDGKPALAPNIPPFIKRAYRDEAYIANLASEVDRFNDELDAIVAQLRGRIEPDFAAAA